MSGILRAVSSTVVAGVSRVVGGLFSTLRSLVVEFQMNRQQAPRSEGITKWENSAKYCGWVMAKSYEDLTRSVFYLFAFNKRNENTMTMAVYQGKAVGCTPEMYIYTKDKEGIRGKKFPSQLTVKELQEIFE